jgi:NTE family protein
MNIDTSGIVSDLNGEYGYRRSSPLQEAFEAAASSLLAEDGWPNPENEGKRELVADLALEGGGVKGIALVGAVLALSEAGYRFRAVAGTSAGAIAATLIASITKAGRSMTTLRGYMDKMVFANFMREGRLHSFLDHEGGKIGSLIADAGILSERMGLYSGDYLEEWMAPILSDLGVRTFSDLRLAADPGQSVPSGHDYRLVVHTSDITRAQLVRLPWDYPLYGCDPDTMDVIEAVRASMSIPFFFEPVRFNAKETTVDDVPTPDGGFVRQHYAGGTVTWVDGGMLRNFPIHAFDRADGGNPRWPTIGIKLSSLQHEFPATEACEHSIAEGIRCLRTMMNEWDAYSVDATTAGRTVFVDNDGISATDFTLTSDQQTTLFINGARAATAFIIEMAQAHGVPRSGQDAANLIRARQSLATTGDAP